MKVVASLLGVAILALANCPCLADDVGPVRRFNVVAVDDEAILIDTATGDTWLLVVAPSADNRSDRVWEKIPSPWETPSPVSIRDPESMAPPMAPAAATKITSIRAKAPHELAVGASDLASVDIDPISPNSVAEIRVRCSDSLTLMAATDRYERDNQELTWSNIEIPRGTLARYAIQVEAKHADPNAVVAWTVIDKTGKQQKAASAIVIPSGQPLLPVDELSAPPSTLAPPKVVPPPILDPEQRDSKAED